MSSMLPARNDDKVMMPARLIKKADKIAKHTLQRRIALGAIFLFLICIDPVVDGLLQPGEEIFDLKHLVVGLIVGLVGFFFMWLTAYLVRRLSRSEFEKQALFIHFDYLSKYANDIVVLIDENRKIVEVNDRALSSYGYTREELYAMDPATLRIPEEREKLKEQIQQVSTENGMIFETWHQRKDGSVFPVEVSSRIFTRNGRKYLQSIIRDITERKHNEASIQLQRDRLRKLAARAERIREAERKSLAREIHDQLGQELTAIKMNIAVLAGRLKNDDVMVSKVQYIRELVDTAIRTTRKISTSLRPEVLDQLGLDAAIEWQAKEFEKHYGIICTIEVMPIPPLRDGIDIVLLRILQESLTNVAKHAAASHVTVQLKTFGNDLHLCICDNGRGISMDDEKKSNSFGILGMKERVLEHGGTISVSPRQDRGTSINACIPEALR